MLVEVFPDRCENIVEFQETLEMATFYITNAMLLPTHNEKTNRIIARNHRIGIALGGKTLSFYPRISEKEIKKIGIAEWYYKNPKKVEEWMNLGYDMVRKYNRFFADELKISPSIRVTTVKPSGTISNMVGVRRYIFSHFKGQKKMTSSQWNVLSIQICTQTHENWNA